MSIISSYVSRFNAGDEEIYKNKIDNDHAAAWMEEEIPRFECPDADIERTWYFRWWTYRKHVKLTEEDGWVITEFLPKVPWSGKHNTINAAVGHHIYEGRWLKNSQVYLHDYIRFFLRNPDRAHQYSAWLIDAVWQLCEVTGNFRFAVDILPALCRYYEQWETEHQLPGGMFWSIDGRDAMEYSISGTTADGRIRKGVRPTLNAYLCIDAYRIAGLARLAGDAATEAAYLARYERLKSCINEKLWEDGFYRAFHFDDGEDTGRLFENHAGESPREEIGYIPWMFRIPPAGRESVFELLTDPASFYSDYGITTAERSHPRYLYTVNHECLWNGYVWPFATSQTLTALSNVVHHYPDGRKYGEIFVRLLRQYAAGHQITLEDGRHVPWIDEVRHAERDEWSSRSILRDWGWQPGKGGYERGKDYNHSTFCDLVIRGLVGVNTEGNTLTADPIIPEGWDWMRLSRLPFRGGMYTIMYDRTGERFGMGRGFQIIRE